MISEINEWHEQLSDSKIIEHVHVCKFHCCPFIFTRVVLFYNGTNIQNNAHDNKQSLFKKKQRAYFGGTKGKFMERKGHILGTNGAHLKKIVLPKKCAPCALYVPIRHNMETLAAAIISFPDFHENLYEILSLYSKLNIYKSNFIKMKKWSSSSIWSDSKMFALFFEIKIWK